MTSKDIAAAMGLEEYSVAIFTSGTLAGTMRLNLDSGVSLEEVQRLVALVHGAGARLSGDNESNIIVNLEGWSFP